VQARSIGAVGRPVPGRPAVASRHPRSLGVRDVTLRRTFLGVVALIASFAVSAPAAMAGVDSDLAAPPADAAQSASQTAVPPPVPNEPAPTEPGPVDNPAPAGPPEPTPPEPAPSDLAPSDPARSDPAPSDPAPENPAPADPAPSDARPVNPGPSEAARTQQAPQGPVAAAEDSAPAAQTDTRSSAEGTATTPDGNADHSSRLSESAPDGESQDVIAIAHNRSMVFQVVWQVQEGCRTHCYRTSQSQSVVQWSITTQTATATAGGEDSVTGSPSSASATAQNDSVTIQFVWQLQIGCVAFCYETSQIQAASQWAETLQAAIAEGTLEAWAENVSETLQYVWQLQEGCQQECYAVSQLQTITQGQSTTQTATATVGSEDAVTMIVLGPDGIVVLPGWLVALAENQGATIQTVYQHQQAICREYCEGDVQLQEAIQEALANQEAIAVAWVGTKPVDEPPATEPPSAGPPAEQLPLPAQPSTPATATAAESSSASAVTDPAPRAKARTHRKTRRKRANRTHARVVHRKRHRTVSQSISRVTQSTTVWSESTARGSETSVFASGESRTSVRTHSTETRPKRKRAAADADTITTSGLAAAPEAATEGDSGNWLLIALAAVLTIIATVAALRLAGGNSRAGAR
jgi:outer membrane biosynthesis protein TonB